MTTFVRTILLGSLAVSAACAFGQATALRTEDELAKQTALLKAQQAYYDQLAFTTKSQQAATDATVAAQTASLTAANALQTQQFASDLAVATALKGSGLMAATGKDGSITATSADKIMLALQRDSLLAIDTLTGSVCDDLRSRLGNASGNPVQAFIAPSNYESLVEKSVADVAQLVQLHSSAMNGNTDFDTAQMQVAGTAIAGALMSAQYLAGGVQAITKLFRTDYNLAYTPINRQGLFEQSLNVGCKDRLVGNVENQLRLNASLILNAWLPEMAKFSQRYDMWAEVVSQRKTDLTAKLTALTALKPTEDKDKAKQQSDLKTVQTALDGLEDQLKTLSKYKAVASAIKTYVGAIGTGSTYDSLVWGQHLLHAAGGLPATVKNLQIEKLHRLTYTLNVQDVSIKATSTFSADKLRYFATAELYYSVADPAGAPLIVGVQSISIDPTQLEVKSIKGEQYKKLY